MFSCTLGIYLCHGSSESPFSGYLAGGGGGGGGVMLGVISLRLAVNSDGVETVTSVLMKTLS